MNFSKIDNKWQSIWFGEKVFEPEISNSKKFFFTIPYPYVSGALHVGHGRTYTNGDIIVRYKRMLGFNVLWPMAFHITGTPVLAISSKIKNRDETTLKLYKSYVRIYESDEGKVDEIVNSFTEPWNIVDYFSSKLIADFKSIGFSLDLSRQFTTGDKEYNKFVEWQFYNYNKKGYLKKAGYPILYCPNDKNAVGEDDISGGDGKKIEVQKFITIKFNYNYNSYGIISFISATLRPDTFYGITNLFLNPDGDYLLVKVNGGSEDGEKFILSKFAVEKLKLQGKKVEVLKEVKGNEFIGKEVKTPNGKIIPIFPASFVDVERGTGVVHSVPAHSPFDYVTLEGLKKNKRILESYPKLKEQLDKLTLISLIKSKNFGEFPAKEIVERLKIMNLKEKKKLERATTELYKEEFYSGVMGDNCGNLAGLSVKDAKEAARKWIIKQKYGFDFYESSSTAFCRCGAKIVVAIMKDQWFIDFNSNGWKEKSRDCLKNMFIYPEQYRKQFEEVMDWLDKRPCARKRGLGTKFPLDNNWIIESLSDSTLYMAFYTVIKKIREYNMKSEDLTIEFFDYVFLGKGNVDNFKKNEKINLEEWDDIKSQFGYWYPNDLRHTAIAHITNHLSFMIFAHTAIFPRDKWPKGFTLNDMLISEGHKMSKSKGNVILLNHISKEYGADAFRLYISSAADLGSVLDFKQKDIKNTKKRLIKFFDLVDELIKIKNSNIIPKQTYLTNWMMSVFERAVRDSTKSINEFKIRDYIQFSFYKLLNSFEYFYRKASKEEKKEVISNVLDRWIKLLTPIIPHSCEEIWEKIGNKRFVSLASWPIAEEKYIKDEIEINENYVRSVLEDILHIKQLVRINPTKVRLIVASKNKVERLINELKKEDVSEVGYDGERNLAYLKKNFYKLKEGFNPIDEKKVLEDSVEFLERETKLKIIVENEESSTDEKSAKSFPNKPAIILE